MILLQLFDLRLHFLNGHVAHGRQLLRLQGAVLFDAFQEPKLVSLIAHGLSPPELTE